MDILLNVVGPVFLIAALGAVTGKRLGFDAETLARLAYWILGPAFAYDALAEAELDGSVVARLVAVGLFGMLIAGLVTFVVVRRLGGATGRYERTAAAVMVGVYGNVGNAGLAMSVFALGDAIRPAATVMMLTINLTGMAFGIALATAREKGVVTALRMSISAPMTLAGLLALALNLFNSAADTSIGLPLMFDRAIGLVADALIPVMLYTLGMQLVAAGRPQLNFEMGVVAVAKLAVAPLAAAALATLVGLTGDDFDVAIIQSAMPPAVFCVVVALEHNLAPQRVTTSVVVTTLASLVTLPIVLALI